MAHNYFRCGWGVLSNRSNHARRGYVDLALTHMEMSLERRFTFPAYQLDPSPNTMTESVTDTCASRVSVPFATSQAHANFDPWPAIKKAINVAEGNSFANANMCRAPQKNTHLSPPEADGVDADAGIPQDLPQQQEQAQVAPQLHHQASHYLVVLSIVVEIVVPRI